MIHETRVSVTFKQPVEMPDIHDGKMFLSNKHWIIAAYCQQVEGKIRFISHSGDMVAEIPRGWIENIKFQRLSRDSALITARNNRNYIQSVKQVKKAQWNRWSDEEDSEFIYRVKRGYSIQTLSTLHNRSEWAIWSRLVYWGLEEGYEAPERGVRVPEDVQWAVEDICDEHEFVCLNCGLSREDLPCKCWNKDRHAKNTKLERFRDGL